MKQTLAFLCLIFLASVASASWYWPFGSDDTVERNRPRLSVLMEPASKLIDEASDLAEDGKTNEAVEKYRAALTELDRIEQENADWVKKPEFATVRNKRAYVNAAIDSLLLVQVKANARAVAVSDTTELEKRLAAEKAGKKKVKGKGEGEEKKAKGNGEEKGKKKAKGKGEGEEKKVSKPTTSLSRRAQAMADISAGDYAAAGLVIDEMLSVKPDDVAALNLKAVLAARQDDFKAAEKALDRAISVHPRNYFAYYNMANLILQFRPTNKSGARRYYETGRSVGGPADANLEGRLK